ncbi:MAG: class I SAM-dependent methyltransferase [Geopsychrobacter sp.]|nr:class I SAM-dependent methyltransferase [Geopsychrobacter sp.]
MTATKKSSEAPTQSPNAARFQLDWGAYSLLKLVQDYHFDQVLDIGSGAGEHKRFLELFGKQVFSVDLVKQADYVGDFMQIEFKRRFEVIWCSHVLEHQRNIGLFLDKIFDLLTDDGVLAITVPIHPRERLISGHLSSWSIPLLCYNLVMAGFDCREARIIETFELGLIVQKKPAIHPERSKTSAHGADAGHEFADLREFFPFDANQGSEISGPGTINWENFLTYSLPRPIQPDITEIIINSKNFDNEPDLNPTITLRGTPNADFHLPS